MATVNIETRTRPGRCTTHGDVVAEKKIPKWKFPFIVYAIRRLIATLQPYRWPTCREKA